MSHNTRNFSHIAINFSIYLTNISTSSIHDSNLLVPENLSAPSNTQSAHSPTLPASTSLHDTISPLPVPLPPTCLRLVLVLLPLPPTPCCPRRRVIGGVRRLRACSRTAAQGHVLRPSVAYAGTAARRGGWSSDGGIGYGRSAPAGE
jgi:hypothetical protein